MEADAPVSEDAEQGVLSELARAKVNLFLHVRGRRPDGRHTLESLAVFPDIGDIVSAERGPIRSLSLDGPFAVELGTGEDNLVMRATEALGAAVGLGDGVALRLEKRLPVAAGIGGGSADAAAALRVLMRLWGRAPDAASLAALALRLGADVPVCLSSAPALMEGLGERLTPAPPFRAFWLVLVNPLTPLSTASVFSALERRENPPADRPPAQFADTGALVAWLARQRNDLEAPARSRAPTIAAVLGALRWAPECRLARMSGSGATCFGIVEDQPAALSLAARLRTAEPSWWVAPARVRDWSGMAADADRFAAP